MEVNNLQTFAAQLWCNGFFHYTLFIYSHYNLKIPKLNGKETSQIKSAPPITTDLLTPKRWEIVVTVVPTEQICFEVFKLHSNEFNALTPAATLDALRDIGLRGSVWHGCAVVGAGGKFGQKCFRVQCRVKKTMHSAGAFDLSLAL